MSENDIENAHKHIVYLINHGRFKIPIEYAIKLYKLNYFEKEFRYFCMISKYNHPIAKYFKGVMLFRGKGCIQSKDEAIKLMNDLSKKGINQASEFLYSISI